MQKTCRHCQHPFPIDDLDQAYYAKMQVPAPTLCPDCRLQRRLSWRVERNLYMRKCDKTQKQILSEFPQDTPYTIYGYEAWYANDWNGTDYGRVVDFSRPLFDQIADLMHAVPLLAANVSSGLQNCDYVNQCGWSKNCYMTIEADHNEDSIHCYRIANVKSCLDCTQVFRSERCYECIDCENCFNLRYGQLCSQCTDSTFLFDCRSCTNCFCCTGMRQKNYCMFNEQLTKEEYLARMLTFDYCSPPSMKTAEQRWNTLKSRLTRKAIIGEQNDNVTGNYIYESKDCFDCYETHECRDCRYCNMIRGAKDCMDYFVWGDGAERIYESECCGRSVLNLRFCNNCWEGVYDLTYCYFCTQGTSHCFGCVGVKKGEYCILNKQYSKDEYEEMVPKIIEHMKSTGEWGEFFPVAISPYCYNETVAQEYFPLSKEEVLNGGWPASRSAPQEHESWKWQNQLPFTTGKETIQWDAIPYDITQVPETIVNEVLACEESGKNFRITKQELLLYKQLRIPLPRMHPDVRHRKRMEKRNPRKLWKRQCMKCGKEMETTYAPDRPEKVYCEECYLKEVY